MISIPSSLLKSFVSSPHGPVLIPVSDNLGSGHFHQECTCVDVKHIGRSPFRNAREFSSIMGSQMMILKGERPKE